MWSQEEFLKAYPEVNPGDLIVVKCTGVIDTGETHLKDDNLIVGKEYTVPFCKGGLNIAFSLERNHYLNLPSYMYVDGGGVTLGYASFEFVRVVEK